MNHHDAEITDCLLVLDGRAPTTIEDCITRLKAMGLEVVDINIEEGIIEGSIRADRVPDLKTVPGVCYVRSVFTYTADFPSGDARDTDGPDQSPDDGD